jgi:hypothetical protein
VKANLVLNWVIELRERNVYITIYLNLNHLGACPFLHSKPPSPLRAPILKYYFKAPGPEIFPWAHVAVFIDLDGFLICATAR